MNYWFRTESPPTPPLQAAARATELDDLLTAVGANRDGEAFAVLFDHFGPRVHAQMVRQGPRSLRRRRRHPGCDGNDLAQGASVRSPQVGRGDLGLPYRPQSPHRCQTAQPRVPPSRSRIFFAIPDPAEGSDDCIDAAQREEHVRDALGVLPQEQFTLVRLAFFEGLSHSAIAEQLQVAARHGEVAAAAGLLALAALPAQCRRDGSLILFAAAISDFVTLNYKRVMTLFRSACFVLWIGSRRAPRPGLTERPR